MRMNEGVSCFSCLNILQLRLNFAEESLKMVTYFKLTVIVCSAGKWTWLTTQLPDLSGSFCFLLFFISMVTLRKMDINLFYLSGFLVRAPLFTPRTNAGGAVGLDGREEV